MHAPTPPVQVNANPGGNRMTLHHPRFACVAALALSLAACGGGNPNGATAISAAAASPRPLPAISPQSAGPVTPVVSPGAKPAQFVAGTLCTQPDQVVFSCPLEKTDKIVSICAAGSAAPHRFYYAFGRANAPELVYPSKSDPATDQLYRTNLVYAAGTAGDAYSFHKHGFEYIAFTLSGKSFINNGVIVRHVGADRAIMHLKCNDDRTVQSENDEILEETLKLKAAEDLKDGLPIYPPGDRL